MAPISATKLSSKPASETDWTRLERAREADATKRQRDGRDLIDWIHRGVASGSHSVAVDHIDGSIESQWSPMGSRRVSFACSTFFQHPEFNDTFAQFSPSWRLFSLFLLACSLSSGRQIGEIEFTVALNSATFLPHRAKWTKEERRGARRGARRWNPLLASSLRGTVNFNTCCACRALIIANWPLAMDLSQADRSLLQLLTRIPGRTLPKATCEQA